MDGLWNNVSSGIQNDRKKTIKLHCLGSHRKRLSTAVCQHRFEVVTKLMCDLSSSVDRLIMKEKERGNEEIILVVRTMRTEEEVIRLDDNVEEIRLSTRKWSWRLAMI